MTFSVIALAIVGIDLGTTNSSVSVMEGQQAWVIEISEGACTCSPVHLAGKFGVTDITDGSFRCIQVY